MRKDGLAKHYDRLTPEERFRLFIEARARGDAGERRNLEKSCPRLIYEMNDKAYEDRVRASEEITTLVCLDLVPRRIKLRMLAAFSGVLAALRNICLDESHSAYLRGRALGRGLVGALIQRITHGNGGTPTSRRQTTWVR